MYEKVWEMRISVLMYRESAYKINAVVLFTGPSP